MVDYIFEFFTLIFSVFLIYVICNVACEYRNYSTGHRFIKAFRERSRFQQAFTVFHKDVNKCDLDKITSIGYLVAVISTITAIFVIPFSSIAFFYNRDIAVKMHLYWFVGCFLLGLLAFFVQLFDSLLNFLLKLLGK